MVTTTRRYKMKSFTEFKQDTLEKLIKFKRAATCENEKCAKQSKITRFFLHPTGKNYGKEIKLANLLETNINATINTVDLINLLRDFIDNNFNKRISYTVAVALANGLEIEHHNNSDYFVLAYFLDDIDTKIKQLDMQGNGRTVSESNTAWN